MTALVRISLKVSPLESLIDWMFAAPETTAAPTWGRSPSSRREQDYSEVSASGIYPALQSSRNVASQGPRNESNTGSTSAAERREPGVPRSNEFDQTNELGSAGQDDGNDRRPPARGEPAITEVYRECAPAIHRMMLRLGIPERYAEDATNDVFVTALPRWNEFRGDSTRRTWLFGFALKVAANQRRKLGRAGEEKALAADNELEATVSTSADPFEQASTRQALENLTSLLDTLTLEERALWLLVYYEDVSVADAAPIVGMATPKAYVLAKWVHAKLVKAWKRSNPPEAWRSW